MEIRTLNDIYAVSCTIDRPVALKQKRGGKWTDVTVPEFRDTVRWFSTARRTLRVKRGNRVAILSENRSEWAMADFGILTNASATVPVYPTLLEWQIEYILNDSGAVAVIASTEEQLKKVLDIRAHCPSIHNVIVCDAPASVPEGVLTFDEVVRRGGEEEEKSGRGRFDELRASCAPNDLATLVYTSGTTGNPKGAMLTHGNITSNVVASLKVLPIDT